MKNLLEIDFTKIWTFDPKILIEDTQKSSNDSNFSLDNFEIDGDFIDKLTHNFDNEKTLDNSLSTKNQDTSSFFSILDDKFFEEQLWVIKEVTSKEIWQIIKPINWDNLENKDSLEKKIVKKEEEFFEIKFKFYLDKISRILKVQDYPTNEQLLFTYSRTLLYILENFKIKQSKVKQIKLMVEIRKVLWDIKYGDFDIEMNYVEKMLKNPYIKTNWYIKEELLLIYNVIQQNYIEVQKEIHINNLKIQKETSEKVISTIWYLEWEMLPEIEDKDWISMERKIRIKRLQMIQKRVLKMWWN